MKTKTRKPEASTTPTIYEVMNAFSYEKVTIRARGIEMDFLMGPVVKDNPENELKSVRAVIVSTGAPRRV